MWAKRSLTPPPPAREVASVASRKGKCERPPQSRGLRRSTAPPQCGGANSRRLVRRGRIEQRHLTAGLLDRGDGRGGGAGDGDAHFGLQFAARKEPDAVFLPPQHTGFHQGVLGDLRLGVDLLVIDGVLQRGEVDPLGALVVQRVEAALRHAHVQRHLAAFEAVDRNATAGLLPLHATPAGLALARADAAAHAHQLLGAARVVSEFVELHVASLRGSWQLAIGNWKTPPTAYCLMPTALFHYFHEVVHLADHALDRGRVLEFDHLLRALEAEA